MCHGLGIFVQYMQSDYQHKVPPWNDYSRFIKHKFGQRVQKISVNTGLSCPNLDGTLSSKGCTYCNNSSFSPYYCRRLSSVTEQLKEGIRFFSAKYKAQKYIAYFQNYTNTYTRDAKFRELCNMALETKPVLGLAIATRPDCVTENQLEYLDRLSKDYYISLEIGVESTLDKSLKRINRGHGWNQTQSFFTHTRKYGLHTCAHLILGLPGETDNEMLGHAEKINKLAPDSLKIHQLQVLKNTGMAGDYKTNSSDFSCYTAEEYMHLCMRFLERLRPELVVERFTSESPREMVICPDWAGMKNFEFVHKLRKLMLEYGSYQSKTYRRIGRSIR